MKTTDYNIARIEHLMEQYALSREEFLDLISEGLKVKLSWDDVFKEQIHINHLKRIDKVFGKGIYYYLDPTPPVKSKDASIFFRKEKFGTDLNLATKKIVNQFEEIKISLSGLAKLSDLKMERKLPVYKVSQSPKSVAAAIRATLYPRIRKDPKKFLEALINKFAEYNILVFEFVETHNKKEKANIDGFFLQPNVVVIKRNQDYLKREIFTLAHELGHYLLNIEEVESLNYDEMAYAKINKTESWCNEFAFHFLLGGQVQKLEAIHLVGPSNDYAYSEIKKISDQTHLSFMAILTYLVKNGKMSGAIYGRMKKDQEEQLQSKKEELKKQRELDKEMGKISIGSSPKPIQSPLFVSAIQSAFFDGIISEYELCKTLHIKPEKLEKYLR